jgi:spermidine synthase
MPVTTRRDANVVTGRQHEDRKEASHMSSLFQELDYCPTAIGTLTLRRRRNLADGTDIYEIRLDDEFLMSSLFTASEVALADLALADRREEALDVVVGGLGLGYTARAALQHENVRSVLVVEALQPVIEWHEKGMLPLGRLLSQDDRCRFVLGDFFAMAAHPETGFDPLEPGSRVHAILLDVDHSPRQVLHPSHASLYDVSGLRKLSQHFHPGGVFALWSNDPPADGFMRALGAVFETARAEPVTFHNPLQNREATQTVYLARTSGEPS